MPIAEESLEILSRLIKDRRKEGEDNIIWQSKGSWESEWVSTKDINLGFREMPTGRGAIAGTT